MAHVPGCRAVRWSEEFVDILPATGGKVNGLQETLNHLGLMRENSIAFGDGGNDTEMLAFAGIGVAMATPGQTPVPRRITLPPMWIRTASGMRWNISGC